MAVTELDLSGLDLSRLTPAERRRMLELLTLRAKLKSENKLADYVPYAKQKMFHAVGGIYGVRERLLMAGNQLGKTYSAGFEVAMHLTGKYPDWWEGKRWDRPTIGWASGITSESTRDNPQRILLGQPGDWGTGCIPAADIISISRASHGVANAVDSIKVRHVSGGVSIVSFKAYEKGREKWQGPSLDFVWFDEEPPEDIYTEGLTRTNVGSNGAEGMSGIAFITFTPLLGMSNVVKRFVIDKPAGTNVTSMTIHDAEHYTAEQRAAIIASYPAHEREARTNGTPTLGSGRIFAIDEELIKVPQFEIPAHWVQLGGLDFGWDHPSGAARIAWDRDEDVIYVTATHRQREQTPLMFAGSIRPWGDWLPWAWPHDGLQHDKGSGEALAGQYKAQGLLMLDNKATHPPADGEEEGTGGNSVEAGLIDMLERMQTGRFKVFSNLNEWFEEFRMYHRKDGKVIKVDDDLMAATRYAYMMRRHAVVKGGPKRAMYDFSNSAASGARAI